MMTFWRSLVKNDLLASRFLLEALSYRAAGQIRNNLVCTLNLIDVNIYTSDLTIGKTQ